MYNYIVYSIIYRWLFDKTASSLFQKKVSVKISFHLPFYKCTSYSELNVRVSPKAGTASVLLHCNAV